MTLIDSLHDYAPALHKKLILVDGPYHTGKSSIIRTLSDTPTQLIGFPLNSDEVQLALGKISIDPDSTLYLLEYRGPMWLELVLEVVGEMFIGAIIVLDSSKPETFRETFSILEHASHAITGRYVLAANKQDDPAAWSLDDLRIALRLNDQTPLFPCIAHDRDSVKTILLALLQHLPQDDFVGQAAAKIQEM